MPHTDDDVIRYARDSGFPLQIALQHAVDESVQTTGWSVRYVEHGWVHNETGSSGFIDLVLHSRQAHRMFVVECKRVRDTVWTFMHYSGNARSRYRFRPFITFAEGETLRFHGWGNADAEPACPEVTFCAIRGQSSSDRNTLLERTGAELVLATEALANSERDFRSRTMPSRRLYFPIIVTTAELRLVDFDPATVSLADGDLAEATVREVPYVCLRKQLAAKEVSLGFEDRALLGDPSYAMEHSIFVVQATRLIDFLNRFDSNAK